MLSKNYFSKTTILIIRQLHSSHLVSYCGSINMVYDKERVEAETLPAKIHSTNNGV